MNQREGSWQHDCPEEETRPVPWHDDGIHEGLWLVRGNAPGGLCDLDAGQYDVGWKHQFSGNMPANILRGGVEIGHLRYIIEITVVQRADDAVYLPFQIVEIDDETCGIQTITANRNLEFPVMTVQGLCSPAGEANGVSSTEHPGARDRKGHGRW